MQSNLIQLSDVDMRLRDAALRHFPNESLNLVTFLISEVRRLRGNVTVMRLVCGVIAEIRVTRPPGVHIDNATIDRWRLPLNDVEAQATCHELERRYPSFGFLVDAFKIRLQHFRDLYGWEDDVHFLRLLFRALAIFEGLERTYVH